MSSRLLAPGTRAADVIGWILPAAAVGLAGAYALACVLAYSHAVPIDDVYRASPESGRGVLRALPTGVAVAHEFLGLTWIGALPVAIVVTLVGSWTVNGLRVEGASRAVAQVVTSVGLAGCVVGVALAVLGVLELLS